MKTFPFLVVVSILSLLFSYFLISPTYAQTRVVTVTATVLEHLTYQTSGQKLIISTNSCLGFSLITSEKTVQFFQPTEQTFNLSEFPFFLTANF
ncbi:MAG: hypothetical protein NT135_00905 [Candidatus Berkelbacteria bacterium]|nr:hypothetical protein [Candidatus Berkelbacteria bacterium]